MKKHLPPSELARDSRFVRATIMDAILDPRNQALADRDLGSAKLQPERPAAADRARNLMHGIFTGEIQALEGAGRTTFDFDDDEAPFALKLDMARQCWDESRHVEISVKLGDWMGTEIGEFTEATFLYEAACATDPILRLCGVNRALEGLAIDVFNTMREFGDVSGDPVLEFCEDWMLADEVTHVKMGSDWLRRLTEKDPERRERALEFQRGVDKLFSLGGFRGETDENPIQLARKLRAMAGFSTDEVDEIAEISVQAAEDAVGDVRGCCRFLVTHTFTLDPETFTLVKFDAAELLALAEESATAAGVPDDVSIAIDVDEALPHPLVASMSWVTDGTIGLWFSGGTFEDPQHQAMLHVENSKAELTGALLRARDRIDGGFEDAPPDGELSASGSGGSGTSTPRAGSPASASTSTRRAAATRTDSVRASTTSPTPSTSSSGSRRRSPGRSCPRSRSAWSPPTPGRRRRSRSATRASAPPDRRGIAAAEARFGVEFRRSDAPTTECDTESSGGYSRSWAEMAS